MSPPDRSDSRYETCPVCDGRGLMTGDGSGWDGTNYHSPGCGYCRGEGAVPSEKATLPSWLPMCSCGHPAGDHTSAGTRFPHLSHYGTCLAAPCRCDEYVEINPVRVRANKAAEAPLGGTSVP